MPDGVTVRHGKAVSTFGRRRPVGRLSQTQRRFKMAQTELQVQNGTTLSVVMYMTLGAITSPPNTTIGDIPFLTQVTGNPYQGYVEIDANSSVSYTPPEGTTLIGNVCFGGPPINCPTTDFPTAVNLFEFS